METIICAALERGLTLRDFDDMTIGMIIDFCTECNNRNSDEPDAIEATQEDFDRF